MPGILLGDLRYAVRTLSKSPGFAAVVVLSLALGIGATSTIFAALNPILFRPLPFPDSDRLVSIFEDREPRAGEPARSPPTVSTYREWKEHSSVFEHLEWVVPDPQDNTYPGIDGAERNAVRFVSPGLFRLLGVRPIHGRHFVAEDVFPGSQGSLRTSGRDGIMLSYAFWQRRFGGDPDIVGQTWGNQAVVGVMPSGFQVLSWAEADEVDIWQPMGMEWPDDIRWWSPIGRLNPGVSIEVAQTQLDAIARGLDPSGVSPENTWRVRVESLNEYWSTGSTRVFYPLMGAAVLLLLIACSNVASLLVGRATNRHCEITTRAALGAGRLRLMRQLLTESVVLALFGGALGVLMAWVGTKLLPILDTSLSAEEIRLDGTVLGFTLGLSLLTAILFGMAPALRASNPDLARSLKQGGRGSPGGSRPLVQNLLVGSQIALTLVLLAGAGLMVNSFVRLVAVDRGFNPERILTARVDLRTERYLMGGGPRVSQSPEVDVFYREVLERVRAVPGVEAAELISLFIRFRIFTLLPGPALPPAEQPEAEYLGVGPGFFPLMGIPLLTGRSFTERDTESSPRVAVITETMSSQYFHDEDPIGRFLQAGLKRPVEGEVDQAREIVGIVADFNAWNPRSISHRIYVPYAQYPTEYGGRARNQLQKGLVLRTTLEPTSLAADLRRIVAEVDPGVPVSDIQTMEARLDQTVWQERFWMRVLGIFATLALVLAVVGIYGVVSYAVGQRTHEIRVRMALGAQRTNVLGMVVRQGMVVIVGGVIVGVLGAVAATRLLSTWLYGVEPTDPATFATVSLLLVGVALLATYVPARRAARVDPVIALHSE